MTEGLVETPQSYEGDKDEKKERRKPMAEKPKSTSLSTQIETNLNTISNALPQGFNKARFVQNALAVLNDENGIALMKDCGQAQVMGGLMKAAMLDLDLFNKEAYLIKYGKTVNFQIDYRGLIKLAKRYSIRKVREINGKVVREGDVFETTIDGGQESFEFKPKAFNTGEIIGAFAWAEFEDGGMIVEVMSRKELDKVRQTSKAPNSPAWKNFPDQMMIKSVIRRLCKRLQISLETTEQQAILNEDGEMASHEELVDREIEEKANKEKFVEAEDADFQDFIETEQMEFH